MTWLEWLIAALVLLVAAGAALQKMFEAHDSRRFPPPGRLVDIGGGRALHLLCAGTSGPAIVIEQGAGEPSILWRSLQEQAASFARVCLYDRAGYGWSPAAPHRQGVDERAADLRSLLAAAGISPPYILVAHSYGGLIVQRFASRYADEVAGIVMVDAIDERIAAHPDYRALIRKGKLIVGAIRFAAAIGLIRLVGMLGGDEAAPADAEAQKMAGAQAARPSFFRAVAQDLASIEEAARGGSSAPAAAPLGDLPLTVITHGKPFPGPFAAIEALWRPGQEAIARLSSQGQLIVAEASTHMIHMDEPALVVAALREMSAQAVRAGPAGQA